MSREDAGLEPLCWPVRVLPRPARPPGPVGLRRHRCSSACTWGEGGRRRSGPGKPPARQRLKPLFEGMRDVAKSSFCGEEIGKRSGDHTELRAGCGRCNFRFVPSNVHTATGKRGRSEVAAVVAGGAWSRRFSGVRNACDGIGERDRGRGQSRGRRAERPVHSCLRPPNRI